MKSKALPAWGITCFAILGLSGCGGPDASGEIADAANRVGHRLQLVLSH